jgi:hypothetical protein
VLSGRGLPLGSGPLIGGSTQKVEGQSSEGTAPDFVYGEAKVSKNNYFAAAALVTLAILLKIVLMLVEIPGSTAPAATAMKPANRAYSTMSWPRSSLTSRRTKLYSLFIRDLLKFSAFSGCGALRVPATHEIIFGETPKIANGPPVPF